jgi:predicted metalloprotease with PDZ domain
MSRSSYDIEMRRQIATAVADATTLSKLDTHIAQCKQDKEEIKTAIMTLEHDRRKMHAENLQRFAEQEKKIGKVMQYIWFAMGIGAAIEFIGKYLEASKHLPGL